MSDPKPGPGGQAAVPRLLLLRHGIVASHQGDVPVTEQGLANAAEFGRMLGKQSTGPLLVFSAETRRTRETAGAIAAGARAAGAIVQGPSVAVALRNPDLYLAGERVDMVSTALALAAQVPGMSAEAAASVPFFAGFLAAPDRVGWWLRHPDPPGDDAHAVLRRIMAYARSLGDLGAHGPQLTVGITHSPVLRACALAAGRQDPGEPEWLTGLEALIHPGRPVQLRGWPPAAGADAVNDAPCTAE
ncbi:MAG TPA: phosphoglycerate mutase family protein [Streptosporangiaceae bacterium]|nr:phosphoglycerate mutase family protein [Streptosporangiaceae bacterium]